VLDPVFNGIREYILLGHGNREIIITQSGDASTMDKPHFGLHYDPAWPGYLCEIRLGMTFFIDLSSSNTFFSNVDHSVLASNDLILWSDKDGGKIVSSAT
jgi:hypothetical protein